MAINQPPITGNPVLDAWMLEVTRQLCTTPPASDSINLEVEDFALIEKPNIQVPGSRLANAPVRRVDVSTGLTFMGGTLGLDLGNSVLGTVEIECYTDTYATGTTTYTFRDSDGNTVAIPDAHLIAIGGMILAEGSRNNPNDYRVSQDRMSITVTMDDASLNGLAIKLTVFQLSMEAQGQLEQFNLIQPYTGGTTVDFSNFGISDIPQAHLVFLGGQQLAEGTDYTRAGSVLTLMQAVTPTADLLIELSYWDIRT